MDKIIRDNVHGYIEVPEEYIRAFIDTDTFQRLRHVEQTSMRCLYPCAHHDRFVHSLGTFHIGRKLIKALMANLREYAPEYYSAVGDWATAVKTFELACLLHDCGHAPFSHVLEKYMDYSPDSAGGLLLTQLCGEVGGADPAFADKRLLAGCANRHEKASALLVWRKYRDDIIGLGADPILVMRMIMGYRYSPAPGLAHEVLNCVIDLLNGAYVDADKLDYIVRDTATSGMDNFSVDLDRLIRSVMIVRLPDGTLSVGYLKTSINVIPNIIAAKNNLFLWIYAHHKVQYHAYLMCRCFEKAVGILFGYDPVAERDKVLAACSRLISVDAMTGITAVSSPSYTERVYLPSDYEIMSLIKRACLLVPSDPDFHELFSRKYKKSVWKSYAEYYNLFGFKEPETTAIYNNSGNRSGEIIDALCGLFPRGHVLSEKESWAIHQVKAKLSATENANIYIRFGDGAVKEYSRTTFANVVSSELPAFFYLYHGGGALRPEDKRRIADVISGFAG